MKFKEKIVIASVYMIYTNNANWKTSMIQWRSLKIEKWNIMIRSIKIVKIEMRECENK